MTEQVYDQREDLHALQRMSSEAETLIQSAHSALAGCLKLTPVSNTSGIIPMDLRILVRPDTVEERSKGGIIIPESAQEKEKYAQCKATVVAIGENAFEEAASRSPAFVKPQPGTRVLIAKYGGVLLKGNDGTEYRIMNDEDIIARLEE